MSRKFDGKCNNQEIVSNEKSYIDEADNSDSFYIPVLNKERTYDYKLVPELLITSSIDEPTSYNVWESEDKESSESIFKVISVNKFLK